MRKTKQIVAAALAAIVAVGALIGCSGGNTISGGKTAETTAAGSTSGGASGEPIKLGGLAPLTGNYAEYGEKSIGLLDGGSVVGKLIFEALA